MFLDKSAQGKTGTNHFGLMTLLPFLYLNNYLIMVQPIIWVIYFFSGKIILLMPFSVYSGLNISPRELALLCQKVNFLIHEYTDICLYACDIYA